MRNNKGFTLIELMIVVAIIAVIAAIAAPNILGWFPHQRIKAASRELWVNMQNTRMGAVKDNKEWAIEFDVANNLYKVWDGGADGSWSTAGDNVIHETITLDYYKSGVSYGHSASAAAIGAGFDNDVTFTSDVLVFNPRGHAKTSGYCYLTNKDGESYAVGARTSGSIVIRRWMGGAWE